MTDAPNDANDPMAKMLAGLWAKSRDGILERVTVLESAALALRSGGLDDSARADAERAAHKLAGVVGTFGFSEATDLAREAEHVYEGHDEISPEIALRLEAIAVALRAQLS